MVTWLGERVTADLRAAVHSHVLPQSPQFVEPLKTGEALSRLTNDTTVIQTAVGSSISMGLRNIAVRRQADDAGDDKPALMLIVLAVIGLVAFPAVIFGRRVCRRSRTS